MARLIWATGMDDLNEALREQYKGSHTVSEVSYLQGLTVLGLHPSDTVLTTPALFDSTTGEAGFIRVVEYLRRNGVRVIFLDHSRPKGDSLVLALIQRGVYDLLLFDEVVLETVLDRIEHPATYGDVEGLLESEKDLLRLDRGPRRVLTWHQQEDLREEEELTEETKKQPKRPALRLGFRFPERRSWGEESRPVSKPGARLITVSGLPGAGVSFVALHLALALSKVGQTRLVEANHRPILAHWLQSPVNWDTADAWVRGINTSRNAWAVSDTLTLFTAVRTGPSLVDVGKAARKGSELVTVVADTRLEEVEGEVDVFVVPPDPEKIARWENIVPRLLVVNMVPPRLPVDPAEYALRPWTDTVVSTCPFWPEQSVAVIAGQALEGMETLGAMWARAVNYHEPKGS